MQKLLLILLCLAAFAVQAQQRTIRGYVLDATDKQPLPGASIEATGRAIYVQTTPAGQFTITVPKSTTSLTVRYVGYLTQIVVLNSSSQPLTVSMNPDTKTLNEVVVTGYATVPRRDVTGSVAVVYAAEASAGRAAASTPKKATHRVSMEAVYVPAKNLANDDKQAGQLTAGEIHDFSKWTLWQDIDKTDLRAYRSLWQQTPTDRYSVQVVSVDGFPLTDVPVRLLDSQQQVRWQARTDNTGRAELWSNLLRNGHDSSRVATGKLAIEATVAGKTYTLSKPKPFGKGNNTLTTDGPCAGTLPTVDVAFVVDATGSMGDEIAYLKAELTDVIGRAKQAAPNSQIRLGSVFYRDRGDTYLTQHRDFENVPDSAVGFIRQQAAQGGGDFPEAVDTALAVALTKLSWSQTAKARLLFLVLDAPPHDDAASVASLQRSVAKAAQIGIRLIPVAASGIDKSTEYLLRAMALGTNGTYVFLTDDSGIGDAHIKPTTDQYTVEKLNALLVRLIMKFTLTPDCQPQAVAATTTQPVRYTEQGLPADTTNVPAAFRFFPNPTRDYLTIEHERSIEELFVMDITGKVLMRETPRAATTRLDMQPYPTGTYLFRFSAVNTWQSGRFVLNR
jgi:hypothetical protein